jgi:hypothetical protein
MGIICDTKIFDLGDDYVITSTESRDIILSTQDLSIMFVSVSIEIDRDSAIFIERTPKIDLFLRTVAASKSCGFIRCTLVLIIQFPSRMSIISVDASRFGHSN